MKWFSGKKAIIGHVAAGILGVVFAADALLHDDASTSDVIETAWMTWPTYMMIGSAIAAWTGVAWRHAFAKGR